MDDATESVNDRIQALSALVSARSELLALLWAAHPQIIDVLEYASAPTVGAEQPTTPPPGAKTSEETAKTYGDLARQLRQRLRHAVEAGVFTSSTSTPGAHLPMTADGVPPLRGDAVRLAGTWGWARFSHLRIGSLGTIDGPVDLLEGIPGARLVFGAGSGPGTIWTPFTELTATGETHTLTRWRTKSGEMPGVGGAGGSSSEPYRHTVPLWDWHPTD